MKALWPVILRGLRAAVATGFPVLISYLAGQPNAKWAALAPVLMAVGKYLRDTFKWEWIPV